MNIPGTVLLSGVVGSTAYGLDHEGSDVDRIGMFARPTMDLLGLAQPKESYVWNQPSDCTWHEARKYLSLALKANPTITELLWLPGTTRLIEIRSSLLSAPTVRNAYLGYSTQQFRRLENRGDGSFSADTRKRTAKHARHLYRLCTQAIILWQTGRLTVRLDPGDAVLCRAFGDDVAAGDIEAGRRVLEWAEHIVSTSRPQLPDEPDIAAAEAWLQRVRREFYDKRGE